MANEEYVEIQDLSVEELKSKASNIVEDNKNILIGIISAIVIIGCGIYYYSQIYMKPRMAEAQVELYRANQYMDQDSFKLALNGNSVVGQAGNFIGYTNIIKDYSGTPAANLAHFYAGVATLNMGNYKLALEFLKEFSGEELMQVQAYNLMGDAASELGSMDQALGYYQDAAAYTDNVALKIYSTHKVAKLLEFQKKNAEAVEYLEEIMTIDSQIGESLGVDKDLIRLK